MPNVARISRRHLLRSRLELCWAIALAALLWPAKSQAQAPQDSLCQPDEGVFFSCQLEGNHKIVSLCAAPKAAPYQSITYRFGSKSKVELTYKAASDNQNRFIGTVSPVGPDASVRQVWFETKGVKYIVTSCVGGDCPHNGGLIALKGNQALMSRACTVESSQPWFSSKVLHFTSDLGSSQSKTDLIQLKDYDNHVDVLYPFKRVN
jgi:hypothetical protein